MTNELLSKILEFRDARDWKQFHTPNQLATAIAIEAAELQEHFLWKTDSEVTEKVSNLSKRDEIAKELADVLIYSLLLANELGVDPVEIMERKLEENLKKYPVEQAKGSSLKYTELKPQSPQSDADHS